MAESLTHPSSVFTFFLTKLVKGNRIVRTYRTLWTALASLMLSNLVTPTIAQTYKASLPDLIEKLAINGQKTRCAFVEPDQFASPPMAFRNVGEWNWGDFLEAEVTAVLKDHDICFNGFDFAFRPSNEDFEMSLGEVYRCRIKDLATTPDAIQLQQCKLKPQ